MLKKKALGLLLGAALIGLAACTPTTTPTTSESTTDSEASSSVEDNTVTVTFRVADEVVHTEDLGEDGGIPTRYDYTPETGELVGWYLTPTFSRVYNFKDAFTEDTTLFGAVSVYEEDTRVYYLSGSGTSPILSTNDWGKNPTDEAKLNPVEGEKNTFAITLDLYANDSFQVTSFDPVPTWDWQFGAGYIINMDELEGIVEGGGGLAENTRQSNITILLDGNYTITLKTYPDHDPVENETTTQQDKINNLCNLTIKRNGDPITEKPDITYEHYIKGANITAWKDLYNPSTKMNYDGSTGNHTLSIYLRANEEFMFSTLNVDASGNKTTGNIYINWENVAEESKAIFVAPEKGTNIFAKDAGLYTFTYDPNEDPTTGGILTATVDTAATLTVHDYYINGTMASATAGDWSTSMVQLDGNLLDTYKLSAGTEDDTYVYEGLECRVGDEFAVTAFVAGSTTTGSGWSNQAGSYNTAYAVPETIGEGLAFAPASESNLNFKCLVAGTYDISLNVYSRIVTITPAA